MFDNMRSTNVVNALIIDDFESHASPPEVSKMSLKRFLYQTSGVDFYVYIRD